jgi:zinc-ribbon domain
MAKALVEIQKCTGCGTEIRAAAQFCFHCGSAVGEVEIPKKNKSTGKLSRKTKYKKKNRDTEIDNEIVEQIEPDQVALDQINEKSATNGNGGTKLRSAASIRNKTRRLEQKRVEIYWEEHENAPNKWFIGISIVLVIFTVAILVVATYLK